MTRLVRIFLASVMAAALLLAAHAGQAFESSVARIETGGGKGPAVIVKVELALTPSERTQGLQNRKELAPDAGMLFDFGEVQPVSMWMKNTYVPLDMLFIDDGGRVVQIAENTTPLSEKIVSSDVPVRAVLELPAGSARRLGLGLGDRVRNRIFERR